MTGPERQQQLREKIKTAEEIMAKAALECRWNDFQDAALLHSDYYGQLAIHSQLAILDGEKTKINH